MARLFFRRGATREAAPDAAQELAAKARAFLGVGDETTVSMIAARIGLPEACAMIR